MTIKARIMKYLPTVAIIIVSGIAFVPGAMVNTISDDIELETKLVEHGHKLNYRLYEMEFRINESHDRN